MNISKNEAKIEELLTRGVEEVIEYDHLKARLLKGEKLRIKFGIDPTGPVLHLGHAVVLRLLKRFQNMGHTVILLVGDFTAKIGDPTGRVESRPPLSEEEIKQNMATYTKQAGKILDIKNVEVRYNSEWFGKMSLVETFKLFSKVTYRQVVARRDFKKRLKEDDDFTFTEFMYPVYQGYDSFALKSDVEVGGTDQKFNMLMGRRIQSRYEMEEQDVITVPLLEGLDGLKKMSKSEENYISIPEFADIKYGKLMTLPDSLILRYFELCTDLPIEEIHSIKDAMKRGGNPRDAKMRLAREIVALYHGAEGAKKTEQEFVRVFQEKKIPDQIPECRMRNAECRIVDVLVACKLATSKGEARRVIEQGGVQVDGKVIKDPNAEIKLSKQDVLVQKGKRHFVKIFYS